MHEKCPKMSNTWPRLISTVASRNLRSSLSRTAPSALDAESMTSSLHSKRTLMAWAARHLSTAGLPLAAKALVGSMRKTGRAYVDASTPDGKSVGSRSEEASE